MNRIYFHGILGILALGGVACGGTGPETTTSDDPSDPAQEHTGAAESDIAPCVGTMSVRVDSGPTELWNFECKGELYANSHTTPVGYLFSAATPADPHGLKVVACKTNQSNSEGVALYAFNAAGVGKFTTGAPKYVTPAGVLFGTDTDPFFMNVTSFGAVGQPIVGNFSADSTKGAVSHVMTGTFSVCRASND